MKNRDIKFRAWDKEEKEMLYWDKDKELICEAIPIDCGDEWTERCEVMQFTGLKDKNGVGIYEGDIVRYNKREVGNNFEKFISFVEYRKDRFVIVREWPFSYSMDWAEIEVIGNIYENSDLLEGK